MYMSMKCVCPKGFTTYFVLIAASVYVDNNVEIYELCGLGMATVHIQKIRFLRKCSWARSVDQIYSKHLAYVFCQRSVGKNIFGKVGLGFV